MRDLNHSTNQARHGVVLALALISLVSFASILVLGILPKVQAQAQGGCSVATLQGNYLFNVRGDAPAYAQDPGRPILVVGIRTFDGEGNLSQVATRSEGGVITQGLRDTGVYTLDPDCTGTMTIDNRHSDIFVLGDGSEGVAIRTDEGQVQSQTFKKR